MQWDPATKDLRANYQFLTSAVAPRPIAWVTTVGAGGLVNVAPFSWYNSVCADPPILMLAVIDHPNGEPKDTVRNLRANGEFVVNVAIQQQAENLVQSSAAYPPEISEAEALGLKLRPSVRVQPPGLAASPIQMECKVHSLTKLGNHPQVNLVLGEVVHITANDAVLDKHGNVDPEKLLFLARMGGHHYTDTTTRFSMDRPRSL